VDIRQYNIIYKLTEDLRSALEGKLKPREEVIHLGRAIVRQVSRSAASAPSPAAIRHPGRPGALGQGAHHSQRRRHLPAARPHGRPRLAETPQGRRAQVREGYDCGLKISGYDDIKVDDVIEAYRVEPRAANAVVASGE